MTAKAGHGVGRSSGAITLANALATGTGAAAGIEMPVEAEVNIVASPPGTARTFIAADSDSPLARATLHAALERFFPGVAVEAHLAIRSAIPPARGLKSSSAVGGAIVEAVGRAAGVATEFEGSARLAASVALATGQSATGAFDDAVATLEGGIVVADNRERVVVRRGEFDGGLCAALWIPSKVHAPSVRWVEEFRREQEQGRRAAAAARDGRWAEALELNSDLVERVMKYDYHEIRKELGRRGAVASGVSGMGPTLVAIVDAEHLAKVLSGLPSRNGVTRTVPLRGRSGSQVSP
ncbi:MAG: shikimate kinase [Thermoplasmata archaeon]|nr:shikimate kinase [Thermoplasmata archaeon]